MKKAFIVYFTAIFVVLCAAFAVYLNLKNKTSQPTSNQPETIITNFEECVASGNPIMESYPRKCIYQGTNYIENLNDKVNEYTKQQALEIAQLSENCNSIGTVDNSGKFNQNSQSWWFEIQRETDEIDDGCKPACVVTSQGNTEINWRCTGAIPDQPKTNDITPDASQTTKDINKCQPEQRNSDVCAEIYLPVCASVQVECIQAPCNDVLQTFSNPCKACQNSRVTWYTQGECE